MIRKKPVKEIDTVEHHQIWEVKKPMLVNYKPIGKNHIGKGRSVQMNVGDFIEIRYAYEWHFRTQDDVYFQAAADVIKEHCVLIGYVWSDVSWKNKAKLSDILELELYDKYKNIES